MQHNRWSRSFRGLFQASCCALAFAAACGSNPEVAYKDDAVRGRVGLGEDCSNSSDCEDPLACGPSGVCVAACGEAAGTPCGPPDDGPILGLGGADGAGGDGGGGGDACIDVDVGFTPQVPTVLLLIDRSSSMDAGDKFGDAVEAAIAAGTYTLGDCPNNNNWRWNVVRDVLMNPDRGIVKPLEEQVRFGLSLYSSRNGQVKSGAPDEVDPAKMCPELIEVPIALRNHEAMLNEFKCSDILDDTPTGESLVAAAATLQAFQEPGPKVIVLATDGEPDTCECPDFRTSWVPDKCDAAGLPAQIQADVVATAKGIHDDDITIHVINVSTPSNAGLQLHLTDVADAGGGNVYDGFSPGALSTAFDDIINGVRSCKIDLDGKIAKGRESTGVVTLDGEKLVLDDPDGWQVNTASQLELLGAACETIKRGDHELSIKFPCESFEPVVR
jgi:hypothetical protein